MGGDVVGTVVVDTNGCSPAWSATPSGADGSPHAAPMTTRRTTAGAARRIVTLCAAHRGRTSSPAVERRAKCRRIRSALNVDTDLRIGIGGSCVARDSRERDSTRVFGVVVNGDTSDVERGGRRGRLARSRAPGETRERPARHHEAESFTGADSQTGRRQRHCDASGGVTIGSRGHDRVGDVRRVDRSSRRGSGGRTTAGRARRR